jgi:hypothetical protein
MTAAVAKVGMLVAVVAAGGCATPGYVIPNDELRRLVQLPPQARGQHVRAQDWDPDAAVPLPQHPPAQDRGAAVDLATNVVFRVAVEGTGNAGAVAFVAVAAVLFGGLVATNVARDERRFDGWVRLPETHPIRLRYGNGGERVTSLAAMTIWDLQWFCEAFVTDNDGAVVRMDHFSVQ